MVTSVISEGSLRVPDGMLRAAARLASRQADLTGHYLRAIGLRKPREIRLPAAAVLELAALLQLGFWERCGMRRHLDVDLPTYREAADQFVARCMKGPAEFEGPDAAPLSRRVLQVWIEHFAWDGQEILAADFIVGDVDEDAFIDVLAGFVWNNRNELAQLLHSEGNEK